LNCRSFAENPSDRQPIARSRVLTSEPCPAIRRSGSGFHEDFIFPPGAFYSKRTNASHAVDFAQHAVRPKLKSEAAAGNDDGGT
jgi:hypothetical protein